MERRKCRRCGYPMTRIITQTIEPSGSRWKACYTCLSCGHKIVAAPAVDAAPVVHGEWIGESDGYADGELVYDVWNCSKCDYCIDDGTDNPELLPNYCPHCGAKMDGEGDAK